MSSSSSSVARDGLRDSLLQESDSPEPAGFIEPMSIEVEMAETVEDNPLLEVVSTWGSAQTQLTFRPLFRSPFWRGVAVHRASPFLFFIVIVAWFVFLIVPEDWLLGWTLVNATIGLLLFTSPLVLMVATHLDHALLLRLAATFEWYFMLCNILGMHAAAVAEAFSASPSIADRCFQLLVAVPLVAISVCVFSMDALVGVKTKWKAGMLFSYLIFFVVDFLKLRLETSDVNPAIDVCWLWCTSTRTMQLSCIATILAFAAKNTVCLMWYRGTRLMIIRPHATLLEGVAPTENGDQRAIDSAL